ncbi:MAG TPA: condensation domain-containing protein, partial [Streptosporangiaceae bacterium]
MKVAGLDGAMSDPAQARRWPLSAAQRGVWLGHQLDPSQSAFNIAEYYDVIGPVDVAALRRACHLTVAETDALRTRFTDSDTDSGAWQVLENGVPSELEFADCSGSSNPELDARGWMQGDLTRPVDLRGGGLYSMALLRLSADRHFWYQRCHHIALDHTGFRLVRQRIAEHYAGLTAGAPGEPGKLPSLSALPSLAVLLDEDAQYLASTEFEEDREYWRDRCAAPPPTVRLGHQGTGPAGQVWRTASALDAAQAGQLSRSAESAGAWRAALVAAAVVAYCHRLTGLDDIVLGLVVAGRVSPETTRVPGMTVNVVPLRLPVAAGPAFGELIAAAGEEIWDALEHQRYPGENLRADLGLRHRTEAVFGPVVNIVSFSGELALAGCRVTGHLLSRGQVADCEFTISDLAGGGLAVETDASAALYGEAETAAHCDRFTRYLTTLAADPSRPVGDVDLLTEAERRQVLSDWA